MDYLSKTRESHLIEKRRCTPWNFWGAPKDVNWFKGLILDENWNFGRMLKREGETPEDKISEN